MSGACITWIIDPAPSWYRVRATDEGPLRWTDPGDERLLEHDGSWIRDDPPPLCEPPPAPEVDVVGQRVSESGELRVTEGSVERLIEGPD
jgi:hypothetical protein